MLLIFKEIVEGGLVVMLIVKWFIEEILNKRL